MFRSPLLGAARTLSGHINETAFPFVSVFDAGDQIVDGAGFEQNLGAAVLEGLRNLLNVDVTRQGRSYDCPDEASIFDRERRMIELKDEVNGLMRELGRPEKYPSYRV